MMFMSLMRINKSAYKKQKSNKRFDRTNMMRKTSLINSGEIPGIITAKGKLQE